MHIAQINKFIFIICVYITVCKFEKIRNTFNNNSKISCLKRANVTPMRNKKLIYTRNLLKKITEQMEIQKKKIK